MLEFEWDAAKAASNLRKHGVPFPYATRVFLDDHRLETVDTRRDYGEERRIVLGLIDDRVYTVAYTPRPPKRRLISARKANGKEIRAYHRVSP